MKIGQGILAVCVIALAGCEEKTVVPTEIEQTSTTSVVEKALNSEIERRPIATFIVDGEKVTLYRGVYNWEYVDETGQKVGVEASALSPFEIAGHLEPIELDINAPIALTFNEQPSTYELRLWDGEEVVATYSSFEQIEERGPYVLEIVGYWDAGRVAYVIGVDIE